jgi:hypothetical protein
MKLEYDVFISDAILMTKGNEIIRVTSKLVATHLVEAGMQKRKGDIFTRELVPEVLGWIGLNRAYKRKEGILEINPVIGVRHQELEELLASLLHETFHPYVPPTISIALGYLTAEHRFKSWRFESGRNADAVAQTLVENVLEFGYPFMTAYSTLPAITKAMEASTGVPSELAYRVPLAYALMGDSSKAENFLAQKLAELGKAENPYAVRYKTFASRFRHSHYH